MVFDALFWHRSRFAFAFHQGIGCASTCKNTETHTYDLLCANLGIVPGFVLDTIDDYWRWVGGDVVVDVVSNDELGRDWWIIALVVMLDLFLPLLDTLVFWPAMNCIRCSEGLSTIHRFGTINLGR